MREKMERTGSLRAMLPAPKAASAAAAAAVPPPAAPAPILSRHDERQDASDMFAAPAHAAPPAAPAVAAAAAVAAGAAGDDVTEIIVSTEAPAAPALPRMPPGMKRRILPTATPTGGQGACARLMVDEAPAAD